ncbi:MAG: peptide-methionine (S)-S-oxide reductase MsrA [Acidobacteriota bacterium]|nr:peptide-methionine (S)-S-oxide reductase MsrA [Acidobacteriota bacterium]
MSSTNFFRIFSILFFGVALLAACGEINTSVKTVDAESADVAVISKAVPTPMPKIASKGEQTAVFAGGCFWGLEAVFEHIKGVSDVESGYSGGAKQTADYETVSDGETGHAESVKITFDPSQVSYEQLLKVFFSVAHDPTQLNRQTPDTGTQYRSAIFYADDEQKRLAESSIAEMTKAKTFAAPIVTQIAPLKAFYKAEDYHQNYLAQHPNQPYIVAYDQPKVENLRKQFPDLFVSKN